MRALTSDPHYIPSNPHLTEEACTISISCPPTSDPRYIPSNPYLTQEACGINLSLSHLGNVIIALSKPVEKGAKAFIPYRDSKLCFLLRVGDITATHTHTRIRTYTHTHIRTHTCTHTCSHARTRTCTHTHTYAHTHACTHTHTHTLTQYS